MAVAAVNTVIGDVMLMAKRNRLPQWFVPVDVVTVVDLPAENTEARDQSDDCKHRDLCDGVSCVMKNLSHISALDKIANLHGLALDASLVCRENYF